LVSVSEGGAFHWSISGGRSILLAVV